MIEKLNGSKTYLALTAIGIVHVLAALGVVDTHTADAVEKVLAVFAAAALRHAVEKAEVPS